MIYQRIDGDQYKTLFDSKFKNFGDKAPIMISYTLDEYGVTVVHENSDTKYFYEWDFTVPVKAFIHKIKQDLSCNHYPRISRVEKVLLDSEEQTDLITKGMSLDEVPAYKEVMETYRIDKILALKDEFILINERTNEGFCYKMNSSGIYFLKSYRNGEYKTPLEAGDVFFKRSILVKSLHKVDL